MRKLKLAMYVSVDGVVDEPGPKGWTGPFWNDELGKLQADYLYSSEALVLGRVTYDGFKAAWPNMPDTGEFGAKMNTMQKFVASRTLDRGEWNATIIKGDLATEINKLKEQPGADLLIYGSPTLVDELARLGLIDEYRMMVHPVIVGSGKRFDLQKESMTLLRLVDSVITSTGVAVLTYSPASQTT